MSRRNSQTLLEGVSTINSTFPRLFLHPDAAAGWLESGDSLDAGAMHHLSNNLSLLCRESARHLVADVGPGKLPRTGGTYTGNGWDGGYTDSPNATTTDSNEVMTSIAWDRRTARSYHLANLIADRELPGGGYGLRVIEVEVHCYVDTNSSLQLYAALTPSYNTPDQGTIATATWSNWSGTGEQFSGRRDAAASALQSGEQTIRMWLITAVPAASPWAQWRCRESGNIAATQNLVYEGHLWVGWRSTDADNQILSINAWEVPEPFAPLVDTSVSSNLAWWMRCDLNRRYNNTYYYDGFLDQSSVLGNISVLNTNYLETDRSGKNGREFVKIYHDYNVGGSGSTRRSYATGPATTVPTDFTIYVVLTPRLALASGYIPVFEFNNGYPSTGGFGIRAKSTGYGVWAEDPTTGFAGSTLAVDTTYILCARGNATNLYFYVNGLQTATVGRPAAGAVNVTMRIGTDTTLGASNYYGSFDIGEILYYTADHSVEERSFTLEYLNRRYGVF